MEIANLERAKIRPATTRDSQQILRLLKEAAYAHVHADWHAPGDWLGVPGFVVCERSAVSRPFSHFGHENHDIMACLAVAADPHPAAWVRMAAIRRMTRAQEMLATMMESVLPYLRKTGVIEIGWLAVESWPDDLLPMLGFRRANWITTFIKEGLDLPVVHNRGVRVRPVRLEDMERLASIEAAAFDPLWRHSAEGLRLARGHALCFDVALVDEQVVGFQYSAANSHGSGAHLVRITVDPAYQGFGIGSTLLKAAVEHYRSRSLKRVSLNTQVDNIASHRLYEKFGFYRTGDQMPVWVKDLRRV